MIKTEDGEIFFISYISGSLQEVQGSEEEEEEDGGEMWVWSLVCLVWLSAEGEEERERGWRQAGRQAGRIKLENIYIYPFFPATERKWEEGLHERVNWEKSMLEFQISCIILKALCFIFYIYL